MAINVGSSVLVVNTYLTNPSWDTLTVHELVCAGYSGAARIGSVNYYEGPLLVHVVDDVSRSYTTNECECLFMPVKPDANYPVLMRFEVWIDLMLLHHPDQKDRLHTWCIEQLAKHPDFQIRINERIAAQSSCALSTLVNTRLIQP